MITVDGNEAAASVAYRCNEVIAIYPITPSSPMGELADAWAAGRRPNLWGGVPDVVEMQSEGGAAGAVHGALQAGALTTTFTASQGLLLMSPNLYKIAGELTAFCMHVAARTVATHALSIFGDHSDVMAARQTGFAQLAASSVQEAQDFACIAQAATLAARVPFMHFFDGFRTSHEVAKIAALSDDDLRWMLDEALVGAGTAAETVDWLVQRGERVGMITVRLFRPLAVADFAAALPPTGRAIGVLDPTTEPGAVGDPLYLAVVAALHEGRPSLQTVVVGGRYGLGSKEFTPAMVRTVFDELARPAPRNHVTVGIVDDCTHTSLPVDPDFDIEPDDCVRAVFFGLGSDGTVGANKNSIKIIGEETENWAQGYFVYDSKKAGAVTISHLRFGPRPIRSVYLIRRASFVACHQMEFLDRFDVLEPLQPNGVFLLNTPYAPEAVWNHLPREVQ